MKIRNFVSMIILVAVMVSMFGCEKSEFSQGEGSKRNYYNYKKELRKINCTYDDKLGIVKKVHSRRFAQLRGEKNEVEYGYVYKARNSIIATLEAEREVDIRKAWENYSNEELKGIVAVKGIIAVNR